MLSGLGWVATWVICYENEQALYLGSFSSCVLASPPGFSWLKPRMHPTACGFFPGSLHLPQNIMLCLEPFPVSGMLSRFSRQLPNHNSISMLSQCQMHIENVQRPNFSSGPAFKSIETKSKWNLMFISTSNC